MEHVFKMKMVDKFRWRFLKMTLSKHLNTLSKTL